MGHPIENIRGTESGHLSGRRIVLGVAGSIAAVKTVELARALARHGADVHAVMTPAATRILHPDALHFATGNPVVTRLTGAVEHVSLLGAVEGRADLLLVAPATANTVAKIALGIDDSPVTTCATVAAGTGVPILVAPAMHEAMLDNPAVSTHVRALRDRGVGWVEPLREERKAKLADVEHIVEEAIHLLARGRGTLADRRCLVIGGATAEPVDAVRVLTNRASGRSAVIIARELRRRGAEVDLWYGTATWPVPADLLPSTTRFGRHQDLVDLVAAAPAYDQVWSPAAIADYVPEPAAGKMASGQEGVTVRLRPAAKILALVRTRMPEARIVAFKLEAEEEGIVERARARLSAYGAHAVVANTAAAFAAAETRVHLVLADGSEMLEGPKQTVLAEVVRRLADPAPGAR